MRIAEIPIATRYFPEASQIGFGRSVIYGLAILRLLVRFALHRATVARLSAVCRSAGFRGAAAAV